MDALAVIDNPQIVIAPGEDQDAAEIGWLYRASRSSLVNSVRYAAECADRLARKKATLDHGQWGPWLRANRDVLGFGERHSQKLLAWRKSNPPPVADLVANMDAAGAVSASRQMWGHDKVRGTQGTGENEWYTPADIIADARRVLGAIDLDPASSEQAQAVVQASQYFSLDNDGLMRMWHGNVWLNPPYAQPFIESFADKMIAEVQSCRVKQAIMLTHNYTDTAWFQKLGKAAKAICFTKGRVRFVAPDGTLAAPTQGQAFFYFGTDAPAFADVFKPLGFVVSPLA